MLAPEEAYRRLVAGNMRYVNRDQKIIECTNAARQADVAQGQAPFAIVLSCADSRVPPEIVFDQGLGDLFVVRVAGNIIAPELLGSIEFAVSEFGTQLVVVLGHTKCGAVSATLAHLASSHSPISPNLSAILDGVSPSIMRLTGQLGVQRTEYGSTESIVQIMPAAIRANVAASVSGLVAQSEVLAGAVSEGKLAIIGAEYDMESGVVDFFESVPSDWV